MLSVCFSLGVSVCQSDHYSRWQITGEQRSPAEPRPVWSRPPRFACVPATGLKLSDGIAANKAMRLSVCHQRTRAKKVWFVFFPLVWSVVVSGMKDTLDPVPIIMLQSVRAESVSVPTTESTKSIWTDHLRLSLWTQMEIWWKMWTVKQALVKRACRSSRESWERLGIVFWLRQGHCEMTRKDSLYREKLEGVCGLSGCFESLG